MHRSAQSKTQASHSRDIVPPPKAQPLHLVGRCLCGARSWLRLACSEWRRLSRWRSGTSRRSQLCDLVVAALWKTRNAAANDNDLQRSGKRLGEVAIGRLAIPQAIMTNAIGSKTFRGSHHKERTRRYTRSSIVWIRVLGAMAEQIAASFKPDHRLGYCYQGLAQDDWVYRAHRVGWCPDPGGGPGMGYRDRC